jgi:hypothetical protein
MSLCKALQRPLITLRPKGTMAPKARTALDELGKDGSFARRDAAWRSWISTGTYRTVHKE